ncbi:DEAD/DEAH box helicase [Nakamurella lactea]|uniref:DEAD/DEAH box helicase n=1 Tax=Nakamurella lactea TaxID=459515 RepID=UPI0003F4C836|nr:DEAD/DEAH box helicase [Nakamurella lactea]
MTDDRDLLSVLLRSVPAWQEPVTHVEEIPAMAGLAVDWPDWTPELLRRALLERGIDRPWAHQAQSAELAWAGRHTVIATGTASGKSLAFQLPALARLLADPRAGVLYLSPTKALAADQFASIEGLGLPGVRPAVYDGDTPLDERDWVREHARLVLTNPDMLHRGVLPAHYRWARLLRRLSVVVIDECHAYRGVFGSHVSLVIRRLRRIARSYGSDPVFVLASATAADPAAAAAALIGADVTAVTDDAAPRAGRRFVLWEPPLLSDDDTASLGDGGGGGGRGENGGPVRRSAPNETARMLADLVAAGARTLAFVRSRQASEQVALSAAHRLERTDPELSGRVAAYRGGYLPEERRALEKALGTGDLLGVASTNALELGIDISGLDAALLAGYPGTLASLWQQAGRAGRGGERAPQALVVFVARDDPLDSYLVHHPDAVFGKPVEAAVTDPQNPYILGPHLRCAAAELRLTEDDLPLFGDPAHVREVLADLVRDKLLRVRSQGWYHVLPGHPAGEVDLRGGGGHQVAIVESATGRMLGTVDGARAPAGVHPGAVHLHRGDSYVVDDLDLEQGVALVTADKPDWTTSARSISSVELLDGARRRQFPGGVTLALGPVRVTEQVVGYVRRRPRGELIDMIELDLPEQVLDTRAVWYTIEAERLAAHGIPEAAAAGALHAAEHAAIGLLPLFAGCDRWDIGGLSTNLHPDTGAATVIVYDGFAGGAGFADRGFAVMTQWLTAVRDAVAGCRCRSGCPSCVQSPKCGNGNHPLFKDGAVLVLDLVLAAIGAGELSAADRTGAADQASPR